VPSRHSPAPVGQCQALYRRTIMRRARSKKQRPVLLAELEGYPLKAGQFGVGHVR